MNAGMNQLKSQAQDLIPKDMKEGNEANKSTEGLNKSNSSSNISNSNHVSNKVQKKKQTKVISKALAIKMYLILLIHTAILTLVEYIIHIIKLKNENFLKSDNTSLAIYWVVFCISIVLVLLLSLMVSKITCFSSLYFIYVLYVILLALDLCIFNIGGHIISFDIFVSILIIANAGSLVVLIFCAFIKEPPSSFWVMCCSTGGIILAIFLCAKLYEEERIMVLVFGVYTFIIYQVMNLNAFKTDKKKKKRGAAYKEEEEMKIPSAMVLPYEFNAAYFKMFLLFFEGLVLVIKGCCTGKKKKEKVIDVK